MVCYVCGDAIRETIEFYYDRPNLGPLAKRHAWHGLPDERPYTTRKPTLKTAFEWAWAESIAIIHPKGFSPIKPGGPKVTDLISSATFEYYGKKLSDTQPIKKVLDEEQVNRRMAGMTMGPFNRNR